MRVMTYNILSGGQARDFGCDRIDAILDVIADVAPDVLALQEANGLHLPAVLTRFKDRLGLDYHAIARPNAFDGDGEFYNLVTLSRYPISEFYQHVGPAFETGGLEAVVETPVAPISFCNVHLHSENETARAAEIETILDGLRPSDRRIVLGDCNAVSRLDTYSDDESEFELRFDATDRLARDFVDIGASLNRSHVPTHPSRLPADHQRRVHRRIDYMFGCPTIVARLRDAWVVKSDLAHRASDHFPLVVDFDI